MRLEVAIPCVDYDDFLALTLPANARKLDNITVLTSATDPATIALARKCGTKLMTTEAWWIGSFNKAAALNLWLESLGRVGPDCWLLVLDADILLPDKPMLAGLDPQMLYGSQRRICHTQEDYWAFVTGRRQFDSFCLDIPPVKFGMVWGRSLTSNPAGLSGYFQLWNPAACGWRKFPSSESAASYDVQFALKFHETLRADLEGFEVLHLGSCEMNWWGRRTPR